MGALTALEKTSGIHSHLDCGFPVGALTALEKNKTSGIHSHLDCEFPVAALTALEKQADSILTWIVNFR